MRDGNSVESRAMVVFNHEENTMYPTFVKAPTKVQEKALAFGVHPSCVEEGATPCHDCYHLLRMSFQVFYGHLLSIGEVKKAIIQDQHGEFKV